MNLDKRLLLLKHLNNFITEQYGIGQTTEDVIGMLNYKSKKYSEKLHESSSSVRTDYLQNYTLILKKRVIDFQYFRKKPDFRNHTDFQIFQLINFRDKIIFNKIFKN